MPANVVASVIIRYSKQLLDYLLYLVCVCDVYSDCFVMVLIVCRTELVTVLLTSIHSINLLVHYELTTITIT